MVRTLACAALFVATATLAAYVWFYPSSSASAQSLPPTCGVEPFTFNTFEMPFHAGDFGQYKALIDLATEGNLFPSGSAFAYPGVAAGDRESRGAPDPSNRIPATVYYAIAWQESGWQNASNSVPWGGVGPTLRSFDCGFGIGQITSGMANHSGYPTHKQTLVGTHPAFNVAEGIRILAYHWNIAPEYRPIAGEGNPEHLEDWYYAIWGYNGFAWSNHPMHPRLDPLRAGDAEAPISHCWDSSADSYVSNPNGSGPVYGGYGDYTFPEIVYGCMRNPPFNGGERMWEPVEFHMPDLEREEVAAAFDAYGADADPPSWGGCASFGCPEMDFPTSFPDDDIEPNKDVVGPTDASPSQFLGSPVLSFSGPSSASLVAHSGGSVDTVAVTATNNGSYIAPFRIRSDQPWLVAYDANGSSSRYLDGNVAIGSETEVVITNVPTRQTKNGHVAQMRITLDTNSLPPGTSSGTIHFEPLYGGGQALSVSVTATNEQGSTPTPTATPTTAPDPTPTPGPVAEIKVPALASDQ